MKIDLTRIIRVPYNISMAAIKPFNRTSMESKPRCIFLGVADYKSFNRTSMESKQAHHYADITPDLLLIEPVWNRNFGISLSLLETCSFNRTSMESKPVRLYSITIPILSPFNRTSMESKPKMLIRVG